MTDKQKELLKWANEQFESANPPSSTRITNFSNDVKNGVKLIKLLMVQILKSFYIRRKAGSKENSLIAPSIKTLTSSSVFLFLESMAFLILRTHPDIH